MPPTIHGVQGLLVLTPLDEEGHFNSHLASQVLNNPVARDRLIENIYIMLNEKDFYGVDFDFEFVDRADRDLYVDLVRRTAERVRPEGFIVTVALVPKTSADQPGLLYEGHDYPGMGEAADLVLLMTYEWGYAYGPPMVYKKHH